MPADVLLINGTCIVNEAMLSGESTPLLKESIQLLEASDKLDVDGAHKNAVLFSGTKILQAAKSCTQLYICLGRLADAFRPQPKSSPQLKHRMAAASVSSSAQDLARRRDNLSGL